MDNLRAEVILKDEELVSRDQEVENNTEAIRNLQQENESLKLSVAQLGQELRTSRASLKPNEQSSLPKIDEAVLVDRSGVSRDKTDQFSSSLIPHTPKPSLSKEAKDVILEELKLNGFPKLSQSAFYWAAVNGKVGPFQIGGYYSTFFQDEISKLNFLQAASSNGHVDVVNYLLTYPAFGRFNTESKTYGANGLTTLQLASEKGHNAVVKALIAAGAHVNAPAAGWKGRTALQAAAECGHFDVVKTLIDAGADVNASRAAFSAKLSAKLYFTSREHVRELLKYRPSDYRQHGVSALQAAVVGGHADIVRQLLIKGASTPNAEALRFATSNGDEEVVKILLESEGDWTQDYSVLRSAVSQGSRAIVQILLKKGFPVEESGLFIRSVEIGDIEILKMLIDSRLTKHSVSYLGCTALQEAAKRGNLPMIDALYGKARVCRGDDTPTALDEAIRTGNFVILEFLLAYVSEIEGRQQDCSKAYKNALISARAHSDKAKRADSLRILENSDFGKNKGRKIE